MKPAGRVVLKECVAAAAAFVAANYLFYAAIFLAPAAYYRPGPLKTYLESGAAHVELVAMGIALGVLVVLLDRATDRPAVRRLPVLAVVIGKALVFLVAAVALEGVLFVVLPFFGVPRAFLLRSLADLTPEYAVSLWVQVLIVGALITFALQARRLIGPGVFWPLLLGRYQRPRTEAQVFLFMDLQGSTTLAESMGHERYSAFLQACFRDLTDVMIRNGARVYQYVGDEVVLNWPAEDPEAGVHAVRSYFEFAQVLREKSDDYRRRFGAVPVFRGGVGAGTVTVAEIGEIKRSIAFHGDPLNTAARILELCKRHDGEVFVADAVGESVSDDPAYERSWQGEVLLRGKEERVRVFGLTLAS